MENKLLRKKIEHLDFPRNIPNTLNVFTFV